MEQNQSRRMMNESTAYLQACRIPEQDAEQFEAKLWQQLSALPAADQDRIKRKKMVRDRLTSLYARHLLRDVITQHFSQHDPDELLARFAVDSWGRPFIDPAVIQFNLAHTKRHVVVCAAAPGTKIGVDIETVRTIEPNHFERVLSADELTQINAAKAAGRPDWLSLFFKYWSIKEAVTKCHGHGLASDVASMQVEWSKGFDGMFRLGKNGAEDIAVCSVDRGHARYHGDTYHLLSFTWPSEYDSHLCIASAQRMSGIQASFKEL